jgi:hypothetical protein
MKKAFFAAAVVVLSWISLFAQNSQLDGEPSYAGVELPQGDIHFYARPDAINKIFSNFGTPTDKFETGQGELIAGPDSPLGNQQWCGFSFTPTITQKATQIRLPLFYYTRYGTGSNDFNVGIWDSQRGLPGKKIVGREMKNMPDWTGSQQDCCKTRTVNITPTQLKRGKLYWVVVTNAENATDAVGVWDPVWNGANGDVAINLGDFRGWFIDNVAPRPAFAVYAGKK